MSAGEWLIAGLGCFVAYPLALLVLAGPLLFTRPFWADETLSWLIASDPDFSHSMAALAGGVDTNAPLLHWIYRVAGNAFGHSPATYRIVSMLAMSLSLLGVYATLRRFTARLPSVAGGLALISLPIILTHTTEARFYGFFLAAAVWTCHMVDRRCDTTSVRSAVSVGIASVFLCSIHYFGILVLGGIVLFALSRGWRAGFVRAVDSVWPTILGAATTACLLPLLASQREALADVGGTWVPDRFLQNLTTSAVMLMPLSSALVVASIIAAALVWRRNEGVTNWPSISTCLWSLTLLPLVLLCVDRLVQPVLVPRYLIPATAAVPLLISACVCILSFRLQVAVLAALGILLAGGAIDMRLKMARPGTGTGMGILAEVPADEELIVVDWRGHLLPIWAARPGQRDRIVFVDDPRITHPDLDQSIPFEREMVRIMNHFYGFPRTIDVDELSRLDRFRLVTEFAESAEARLGRATVVERSAMSLLVDRRPDPVRPR